MSAFGLSDRHVRILRDVFARRAENIEWVGVFGSRAQGSWRPNSDIDIVVYGRLTERDVMRLRADLAESDLPLKADVAAYDLVTHAPLRAHIDAVVQPLFRQEDLQATQATQATQA